MALEVVSTDRLVSSCAAAGAGRDIRARREPLHPALPRGYVREMAVIFFVYVSLYGTLVAVTRGVPFVTDGNENFSMLLHAANMYHFPLADTFGLSDEALSQDAAAHPYVYTHQGNFPRLFSFALYVLGATTVESQIIITTFTLGLLSVLLMYSYIRAISSSAFATLAVVVFLTDYLLFAQWQVNTYRVWGGLFFFLSLLSVHGLDGRYLRRWLLVTFANFACLFYFELVFATFVAVMTVSYAAVRYWRRPALIAGCWLFVGGGAALGIMVLAGQLVAYLGWSDFLQDLRLTYTARNIAAKDPSYFEQVRQFVETRHLAFWFNFASAEYQRSPTEIVSSIAVGYFTAYTPTLWYLVTIVGAGWFAGLLRRSPQDAPDAVTWSSVPRQYGTYTDPFAWLLLIVPWTRFLLAVAHHRSFAGLGGSRLVVVDIGERPWMLIVAVIAAVCCTVAVSKVATGCWSGLSRLSGARLALAAAILLVAEHVVANDASVFDLFYLPLWLHLHGTWFPGWGVQLAVIFAGGLSVLLCLTPSSVGAARWPGVASYLACGLLAYVVTYALSPGYVQSVYLQRWVPFASFVFEMAIALTVYLSWQVTVAAARNTMRGQLPGSRYVGITRIGSRVSAAACVAFLLFVGLFWLVLQSSHVRLLPPTHFGFMKQLGAPPFRGASFASSTYAAPLYAYTAEWAYFDPVLGGPDGGLVSRKEDGFVVNHDARSYLWLADRERNPKYARPAYFLCFQYQDLRSAVYRINGVRTGCSSMGVVKYANDLTRLSIADRIVARDSSGEDRWAIVKLNWSLLDSGD